MSEAGTIFSVGHSNRSYLEFLNLVQGYGIDAIADVRSVPSSRFNPDFNGNTLSKNLKYDNIAYVFMGAELGGRPKASGCYVDGRADYERMAQIPEFLLGLERLIKGRQNYQLAMMCSERHPLDCHRCLLVARELKKRKIEVCHIISEAESASQTEIETQLLEIGRKTNRDLFASPEQLLADAYKLRSQKVAFSDKMEG